MPVERPDLTRHGIESWWLSSEPASRTLLLVGAHPDDETGVYAGTIARYAAAGVAVHYVCATRGECGAVAPDLLAGYPDAATLRMAELRCAARALGLAGVHFLGHRDSGMAGAPDNRHPAALVQAPPARVTGQLVALVRALRPRVVATFGPYGGYGHPDHIRMHEAGHAAFAAAGDETAFPEQLEHDLTPYASSKLYDTTFGTLAVRAFILGQRLRRKDPRRFGEHGDVDLLRVVAETTPITAVIDARRYLRRTDAARRCHRSQLGEFAWLLRLPAVARAFLVGTDRYTRVVPPVAEGEPRERDLFAGLGA